LDSIEFVIGSGVNDTIKGSTADNSIYGNAGNDTIFATSGNDYINGGSDNDTLSFVDITNHFIHVVIFHRICFSDVHVFHIYTLLITNTTRSIHRNAIFALTSFKSELPRYIRKNKRLKI